MISKINNKWNNWKVKKMIKILNKQKIELKVKSKEN